MQRCAWQALICSGVESVAFPLQQSRPAFFEEESGIALSSIEEQCDTMAKEGERERRAGEGKEGMEGRTERERERRRRGDGVRSAE